MAAPAPPPFRLALFLAVLLFESGLFAQQFSWVHLTALTGDLPNGQVGLTALNGRLIMSWGSQGSNELTFSTSTDGINWTAPQYLSGLVHADPISQDGPPYASGGVNMTASPVCNAAYVSWADPSGNDIYVAKTQDGQNWSYAGPLVSVPSPSGFTSPGTSSPALYGGNSQPVIEFAYPVPYGNVEQPDGSGSSTTTIGYQIEVGQFNCDFSGVQLQGGNSCFFYDYGNGSCQAYDASFEDYPIAFEFDEGYIQTGTPSGPWSPVWGGSGGVEVKALSQGNPLNNAEPPTYFSINGGAYGTSGALQCAAAPSSIGCPPSSYYNSASEWSNNGGAVVVVPSSGTPFWAKTCAPVLDDLNDHDCKGHNIDLGGNGGMEPYLSTYDLVNGYATGSANWSVVAPATAYFENQIWFAMCGEYSCQGGITVGSVYPAQLTGCTYATPDLYVPGSATSAEGTVYASGPNGGCIWGAFSGAGWPWPALEAHGDGNGSYSFPVSQNFSASPLQYSLTAAANQTVTVYQGTVGGSPGAGSVTFSGSEEEETINECPGNPYGSCWATIPNNGVITVTVNGATFTVDQNYGAPDDTPEGLAAELAGQINSQPPDSAVSATVSGSTVYITSNLNGSNTNYSLSASSTYTNGFSGPAIWATASGATLVGGSN